MKQQRTIAIDFDGVLHQYDGYQYGLIQGPRVGALDAVLSMLAQGHTPVVFTTRDKQMVQRWLDEHHFPALEVTNVKRPFWAIIDDRAITFDGDWTQTLKQLREFTPYWIRQRGQD